MNLAILQYCMQQYSKLSKRKKWKKNACYSNSTLQISIGWLSVISSVIPLALKGILPVRIIPIGKILSALRGLLMKLPITILEIFAVKFCHTNFCYRKENGLWLLADYHSLTLCPAIPGAQSSIYFMCIKRKVCLSLSTCTV